MLIALDTPEENIEIQNLNSLSKANFADCSHHHHHHNHHHHHHHHHLFDILHVFTRKIKINIGNKTH